MEAAAAATTAATAAAAASVQRVQRGGGGAVRAQAAAQEEADVAAQVRSHRHVSAAGRGRTETTATATSATGLQSIGDLHHRAIRSGLRRASRRRQARQFLMAYAILSSTVLYCLYSTGIHLHYTYLKN